MVGCACVGGGLDTRGCGGGQARERMGKRKRKPSFWARDKNRQKTMKVQFRECSLVLFLLGGPSLAHVEAGKKNVKPLEDRQKTLRLLYS